MSRRAIVLACAVVVGCAFVVACASPLTVAEPRDAGEPAIPTFGDAGALDGGEGGDAEFIGDPPEDGAAGG